LANTSRQDAAGTATPPNPSLTLILSPGPRRILTLGGAHALALSVRWLIWANGSLQLAVGTVTIGIGIMTVVETVFW